MILSFLRWWGPLLAYAVSDEWHQRFVPRRSASLEDLAVDCLGISRKGRW
ncbi:MAG TPA: VanZ family protein [Vicinamibacteria bacterium]|nr:VanZ family protein [Vicinamibacteria bacterium]